MKSLSRRAARVAALSVAFAVSAVASAAAQTVLFDFNSAPQYTSLPLNLTEGGITAHLSATGQGFSIQGMSAPVAPVGFSGRFLYANSVFPADLLVSFDQTLSAFSILYAPEEYGCDDSAMMRVTAFMNGNLVGSSTHTASAPGTWPVDTLSCNFPQGFNSVVVHYDSHPPTCQDWGPVFLADDMRVTPFGSSAPTAYCTAGTTSHGCSASIAGTGTPSASATSGFTLTVTHVEGAQSGLIFYGVTGAVANPWGATGFMCVKSPLERCAVQNAGGTNGGCNGVLSIDWNQYVATHLGAVGAPFVGGETVCAQGWFRDPPSAKTTNLSNGLQFTVSP